METIFNIFGSRDSVQPPILNTQSQRFISTKGVPSESVLPGKQNIKNEGPTLKGKKVLGDVGNKIKGLNLKMESNSNDNMKKPHQGSHCTPSVLCSNSHQVTETSEKYILQEKPLTSQLIMEDCADLSNFDKWPEVETHGPLFWADDNHESLWPDVESPTIENFCLAANIWDLDTKWTEHPESPISQELDDNIQYYLDLPSTHASELVLDESEVKFPWEM